MKVELNEVSQTFNLNEILGADVSERKDIGVILGQKLIDLIIERTESGVDRRGRSFSDYSDEYIDSDEFAAYGKSEDDVNMTLSGAMLADLDILENKDGILKIGFRDDTQTKKAYNHNTGDTVPARRFFGVSMKDVRKSAKDTVKPLLPKGEAAKQAHKSAEQFNESIKEITNEDVDVVFNAFSKLIDGE